METDLKFRPFRSPADPGWDEAWAIYQNSFPQKEIRSLEDHLQALSDPHYTADGIWSDGRLIGILYYWTAPEYVYIEHLAISPDLRGANMGSRVLEAFCRKAGRIVLEIDPPETEIAVRRLRFYERLGFVRNDYHYVHPSFQRPYEPHQLVLMSYPKAMTDEECRSFERFVRDPVLRYSPLETTGKKLCRITKSYCCCRCDDGSAPVTGNFGSGRGNRRSFVRSSRARSIRFRCGSYPVPVR